MLRAERALGGTVLLSMVGLPLAEIVARTLFRTGVPGSGPFVQHLTLWVALLGAALAAREEKLLALATGQLLPEGAWRQGAKVASSAFAAAVCALLVRASLGLVAVDRAAGTVIALGVRVWMAELVLPAAFALIAWRLVWQAADGWRGRLLAALGLAAGLLLGYAPGLLASAPLWSGLAVVLLATLLGSPLFAVLGGAALFLFMAEGVPIAAVPAETYRMAVSATLPAVPLFTLAGFLLAEGRASERLVRLFRALFGWIPGGTAVVCAAVCAFFTVFTGGSGVTILALGGLLFQALQTEGYREKFSLGLLTAAGSLGLLLPPALPLILYGVVAQTPIVELFLGGLVPGLLMIGLIAAMGVREGSRRGARRAPFSTREALAALWGAKWEVLLPVLVLAALFTGLATLVETAALAAFYALVVQTLVQRELGWREVGRVLGNCVVLIGGVLVILGVAMGLTGYLVDAQVPARLVEWAKGSISSPLVFLLALNLFLLVVGCLMDIFSAIVVVVPLIVPLGAAFGIHPVHLGIIFIANLELGYLTPPIGLNLFLASYRFERPILEIYRAAVPMLLVLGAGVLLITYVPWLTTGLLSLLGR